MPSRLHCSELEALNLTGCGLREFGHEFYPARILVRRKPVFDMAFQTVRQCRRASDAWPRHDERLRLDEILIVRNTDHCCFQYIGMRHERGFHLKRGNV